MHPNDSNDGDGDDNADEYDEHDDDDYVADGYDEVCYAVCSFS